jgi:hypothetical protein
MRGVSLIVAMGLICELGDPLRDSIRVKLMARHRYLVQRTHSSDKRRLGSITKMGNTRARRCSLKGLIVTVTNLGVSAEMVCREGLPQEIKDIASASATAFCVAATRPMYRGKHRNIVVVSPQRDGRLPLGIIQLVPLEPIKPTERVTRVRQHSAKNKSKCAELATVGDAIRRR